MQMILINHDFLIQSWYNDEHIELKSSHKLTSICTSRPDGLAILETVTVCPDVNPIPFCHPLDRKHFSEKSLLFNLKYKWKTDLLQKSPRRIRQVLCRCSDIFGKVGHTSKNELRGKVLFNTNSIVSVPVACLGLTDKRK